MTQPLIAFFGHNVNDAAVRRRAVAFQRSGYDVVGYMPHRGPAKEQSYPVIDLGETQDNAYAKRVFNIFTGAKKALQSSQPLRRAELIYARNLDMLAMAARVKNRLQLDVPLVYECLDVHHRLTGNSIGAGLLRKIENRLLKQTALVVVSSPRFESEHFERYHAGDYRHILMENRLIEGDDFGGRPKASRAVPAPLRLGWFGNLRCRRSMESLKMLARKFPDELLITLRGYPARSVFPEFENDIQGLPNLSYEGPYSAPEDLEKIYSTVDCVWACDWYEDGANSMWLLPNRIYEGGYFACPAIAAEGTETANWLTQKGGGLLFRADDQMIDLERLIQECLHNRAQLEQAQNKLRALPDQTFVEPPTAVHEMYELARASARR